MSSDATAATPVGLVAAVGVTYFPVALLARLPYAMMVVGVLTLVVTARGSLGLGGIASAMVGLGAATVGPLLGLAADRFGQRPVLLVAGPANAAALLAITWVAPGPWSGGVVLACAFLIGATAPQVSPMSRSRLIGLVSALIPLQRRARVTNATMAYESTVEELTFVLGPVIAGMIATGASPAAALAAAAAITAVFVTAFALHPSALGPGPGPGTGRGTGAAGGGASGEAHRPGSVRVRRGLVVVVVGVLGLGLLFGSTLAALTAFMGDLGRPEGLGLVYGALGAGSAVFALGSGLLPAGFRLSARWLVAAAVVLVGTVAIAFAPTLPAMVVALIITGTGVGPTLVTAYALAAERTPIGRSATTMTIVGSAVIVGQAAASAMVGRLADGAGPEAARWTPLVAAGLVAVAGLVNLVMSRRGH